MKRDIISIAVLSTLMLAVAQGAEVKVRNFTVNPSTGPLGAVDVYGDWKGSVMLTPPEGWVIDPQIVKVEGTREPFRVVKATEQPANKYGFAVTVDGKVHQQTVCVASAPYGKLVIDARPDKLWQDGISLDWKTNGKNTVLRMFWNEENLYLAVEMEGGFKSLQYGLGFIKKNGTKVYHEFETDAQGKTARLTIEDGKLTKKTVAAKTCSASDKGVTICEIELPMEVVEGIRFDAGREFYFSLIVQDSDGKIRDLGERMNRPACAKRGNAWMGIQTELYDAWSIFGCCSSIH
ncbi:MAG: hypothetical protein WCP12_00970 [bacterium]